MIWTGLLLSLFTCARMKAIYLNKKKLHANTDGEYYI